MKPPRYLLREYVVKRLLKGLPRGRFLEIGYGEGNMLVTLASLGYWGDGYDFSGSAVEYAKRLLAKKGIRNIRLLDELDTTDRYDYILFFEVIGYWKNPAHEISCLMNCLSPNGRLIFSFTNKRSLGYAEKATGNMQCFTRSEIIKLVEKDVGLAVECIWNYGFPLANFLKPVLNLLYLIKSRFGRSNGKTRVNVKQSGLATRFFSVKLASILLNPVTIYPFAQLQSFFKNTDLGNGYIVILKKRHSQFNCVNFT